MKLWPDSSVYDVDRMQRQTDLYCEDESRALQSGKEEADINTIVRRFGVTGQVPVNVRVPTYESFEDVFDFQSAMNAINEAERSFMAMPAEVRTRFSNDPQLFLEFCSKAENLDEMRKLGLAVPKEAEPAPPAAPPV